MLTLVEGEMDIYKSQSMFPIDTITKSKIVNFPVEKPNPYHLKSLTQMVRMCL